MFDRFFAAACVTACAVLAGPASAQYPVSQPDTMFFPGYRVPLSEFQETGIIPGPLSFRVHPEILTWLQGQGAAVQITVESGGSLQHYANTGIDYANGIVHLSTLVAGRCVVTTPVLKQELVINTHWKNPDPTIGLPRGGRVEGASDGLSTYDFDFVTLQLIDGPSLANNTDPANELEFNSETLALFSDGSGVNEMELVPAYERYIGENYATHAVTPSRAIWLSDKCRELTGFPVAHRSQPDAFDPTALPRKRVADEIPIFQIAHAHEVDIEPLGLYPGMPGKENSLGSFLLPPGWDLDAAAGTYPILFNGFYDVHASTFGAGSGVGEDAGVGLTFLSTLAGLHEHPSTRQAIALLWNGGGATGTFTTHRSAYDNASEFIQDAAAMAGGDPERVVFSGGSRGGLTALEMGSNPYDLPYTAKFVLGEVANTKLSEAMDFAGPCYSLGMRSIGIVTGYKNAWKTTWREPDSGLSGRDLLKLNSYGTLDSAEINQNHDVDSALYRDRLEAEGAVVVLRSTTHDYSRPFVHTIQYVHNLRSQNPTVPLRFEISYRAGHTHRELLPTVEDLMNMVFDPSIPLAQGTYHFKINPADPADNLAFTPFPLPLVWEAPLMVGAARPHEWIFGQSQLWSFVGEPGAIVQIHGAQLPNNWAWFDGPPASLDLVTEVTLSNVPGEEFGLAGIRLRRPAKPGKYWWYEARYSTDGGVSFQTLGLGNTPAVLPPVGTALTDEPVVFYTSDETLGTDFDNRTGGLSGD